MSVEESGAVSSKLSIFRYIRPILYVGIFFVVGFLFFNTHFINKASAAIFSCAPAATGTGGSKDWNTAANWTGCNGNYPGALSNASDTYNVTISETVLVTWTLSSSPAFPIGTLSITGNGVAHTLTINGKTLTTTGAVTINAPTASATNTIGVDTGSFTSGGLLTITAGASSGRNSTLSFTSGSVTASAGITMTNSSATATLTNITTAGILNITGTVSTGGTLSLLSGTTTKFTGTSTLSGAYTWAGPMQVNSGTTTVSAATTFSSTTTVANGATLSLGTVAITFGGDITVGSGTSGIINTSASGSGNKTFSGNITVNAGGSFDLSGSTGANSLVGGGKSVTNNSTNVLKFPTGSTTFTTTGTFTLAGSGAITWGGGTMTVLSGLTLTNNNTNTVTIAALTIASPTASNGISLTTGSTTTITGALAFTTNAAAGNTQTVTMNGTANLNAGSISMPATTSTGTAKITCASGATGTLSVTGTTAITGSATASGGLSSIDFGTVSTACNFSTATLTITGGSVSNAQLKMGSGTFTTTTTTVAGGSAGSAILTLGSNTSTFNGSITFGTSGNITRSILDANSNSITVNINGSAIGANGTINNFQNVALVSTGTSSIGSTVSHVGTLTVSSGTLTLGAVAITVDGTTSITGALANASSATLKTFTGAVTINSGGSVALTTSTNPALSFGNGITASSGAGSINWGTGATAITATQAFAGASNMTFGGTVTIANTFTLTNNDTGVVTFTVAINGGGSSANYATGLNSQTKFGAAPMATGSLTVSTSANTIEYTYATPTCKTTNLVNNYYHLIFSGASGAVTCAITAVGGNITKSGGGSWTTSLTTVPGNFSVSGTATVTLNANLAVTGTYSVGDGATTVCTAHTLSVTDDVTIGGGTSGTFTGTSCTGITLTNDLTINSGATFTKMTSGNFTFNATANTVTWTDNNSTKKDIGTVVIGNGSLAKIVQLATSVRATTINITTGATLNFNGTRTLELTGTGSAPITASGTFTASTGTVSYIGTSNTTIANVAYNNLDFSPASGTPTYTFTSGTVTIGNNLTLNGAGTETVNADTNDPVLDINGDVTIGTGDTFVASATGSFTVGGSWNNSGTFTSSSGTVIFDSGSTGKTITEGTGNFNNIVFNNASGGWSPSAALTVAGDLTVTAGTLSGTQDITVNGGDVTGNGTINTSGGTFSVAGTGNFGGNTNWTFNNLSIGSGSGNITPGTSTNDSFSGNNSYSFSHTVTAGNDRLLIVSVNGLLDSSQLPSVTYNSVPMTLLDFSDSSNQTVVVYYLVNPAVGAHNVGLTFSGPPGSYYFAATNFTGVNQSVPLGTYAKAAGDDTNPTVSVSSASGELVYDSVTYDQFGGSGTATQGVGQTKLYNIVPSSDSRNAASYKSGSASTTMSWTYAGSAAFWSILAVPLKPAAVVAATTGTGSGGLTVAGNFAVTAGSSFAQAASTTLTVGGNFDTSGAFTPGSGTVAFNNAANTTVVSGSTTFNNLTIATADKNVQFTAGQTFTTNGLLTITGTSGHNVVITSTTGSSTWTINHQGTESVNFLTISWSACDPSSTFITSTNTTDGGNNGTCWFAASGVTISGIVYLNDGSTPYGTVTAMKLSVNGGTAVSTSSVVTTGAFSFTGVTAPSNGDILTVWLDTAGAGGVFGTLILKYGASCAGTPNCTGLSLVRDRVTLNNKHSGNFANSNFSACDLDTGTGCSDADIGFSGDGTNLVVSSGFGLSIVSGTTFVPGGSSNVTVPGAFTNAGAYTASTGNLTVGGNFANTGTFTAGSGTITFNDATQTSTISGTNTFNNFAVTTASKNVNFTAGTTTTINGLLTVTGTNGAPVVFNSSTGSSTWTINHQGTESITYLSISWGACNVSSTDITVGVTSINGGHNGTCWVGFLVRTGGGGGSGESSGSGGAGAGGGGSSGGTSQATATASFSGGAVTTVTVNSNGSGYTDSPSVCFSGGGGSGATATAIISGTGVGSITVTFGGTGYSGAPTVIIAAPPGGGSCGSGGGGGGSGGGGGGSP